MWTRWTDEGEQLCSDQKIKLCPAKGAQIMESWRREQRKKHSEKNQIPNRQTTCNYTNTGPQHSTPSYLRLSATLGLHNQSLWEVYHASCPNHGLDLTAGCHCKLNEWANACIRWRLPLWRNVLFTDESRFSLYRADVRQLVCCLVGDWCAENIVDRLTLGGGWVTVWEGVCYIQQTGAFH